MGSYNTIYRIALFIPIAVLLATAHVKAESLQLAENPFGSPAVLPEKQKMKFISFLAPRASSGIAGGMAVYDDVATKRIGDYAEIYNPTGALIAVIWFDEFGILRSAIDRGGRPSQRCRRNLGAPLQRRAYLINVKLTSNPL